MLLDVRPILDHKVFLTDPCSPSRSIDALSSSLLNDSSPLVLMQNLRGGKKTSCFQPCWRGGVDRQNEVRLIGGKKRCLAAHKVFCTIDQHGAGSHEPRAVASDFSGDLLGRRLRILVFFLPSVRRAASS